MADAQPLPITPPPGVVKTEGELALMGRWKDSNMVRFRRGRPEKRGGWINAITTPTSGNPRAIHAWRDNSANNYMAAGTYRKLYAYDSSWAQNDITPFRSTGSLGADPFTTTSGSSLVSVAHVAHGVTAGDTVIFAGSTAVNGITPNGTFIAQSITDANNFIFDSGVTASGTGAGGGAGVTYEYEINVGVELGTYGFGWGVGPWGLGTWGTARTASSLLIEPRVWALDHFGQLLIASYNGGTIYTFDPTVAQPWPRAVVIAPTGGTVPTDCRWVFVTPERFVFALRAGMVVSWSDQGDYTYWNYGTTGHTSQSRTLAIGTKLVGGKVLGPFVSLVWSDAALYVFQYTGSQFVYDSAMAGRDCGLIAPNAAVCVGGVAYWMGTDNFWMYNGSVQPMPNVEDIRRFVFNNLNQQALYLCHAAYNPTANELEFFYATGSNTTPMLSVTVSLSDFSWAPHTWTIARVSSTHFDQGDTRPYFGGSDGNIYQHENGVDDNGSAMTWFIQLAKYALANGHQNMLLDGVEFDFYGLAGTIAATITAYDRADDTASMDSDSAILSQPPGRTDLRVGGRYIDLYLTSSDVGGFMRLGTPMASVRPHGRRR